MEEGVGEREKMNLVILPHQLAAGGSEPATDAVGISLLLLDSLLSFFLSFFLFLFLSKVSVRLKKPHFEIKEN